VGDDRGHFPDWVEEILAERALREIEPLDSEAAERLLVKLRSTPRERVSPREDQAFVLLLSLAVLNRQFIHRQGKSMPAARSLMTRSVDLSTCA